MQHRPPSPGMPDPRATSQCVRTLLDEHAALAAMLKSVLLMIDRGPGDQPEPFFEVLRAMLFYVDEFPEKLHHPKESKFLFPMLAALAPQLRPTINKLERQHARGETRIRALQHHLVAWEMLGEPRKSNFAQEAQKYVADYLEHMRVEETEILPAANALLTPGDWKGLDTVFGLTRDPFAGASLASEYDRLFTKIVTHAPAPIGVGRA